MGSRAKAIWRAPRIWVLMALVWLLQACLLLQVWAQATPRLPQSVAAIAYDAAGNLFLADSLGNQVFEATLAGTLIVVAGNGVQGYSGDGGLATAAELSQPQGLAVAPDGTLYIADTGNHRVRSVGPGGVLTTVAGTGVAGDGGSDAAAAATALRAPTGLSVVSDGAVLLCDTGNHRVRRLVSGVLTTIAGNGTQGFAGDGGPATLAELDSPTGVTAASDGRIFIADTRNHRVRVVGANGVLVTVAGNGLPGYSGDAGQATAAQLRGPRGLAMTDAGKLLIADAGNQRVRAVDPAGVIVTVAGTGAEGSSPDGATAMMALMDGPRSVAVSPLGIATVADALDATVRGTMGDGTLFRPAALAPGRQTTLQVLADRRRGYGESGGGSAQVTGSAGTPQGGVQITEASRQVNSTLLHGGTASLDLGSLDAGEHTLQVSYPGDGFNPASISQPEQVTVTPRTVTATADPASMRYGDPVPSISGVLDGVLPADSAFVTAAWRSVGGDSPAVGTYAISATLGGAKASNYSLQLSAGAGQLTVSKADSFVALAPVGTVFAGMPVTIAATVSPPAQGQPGGSVEFLDGNVLVTTATLSGGRATALYPAITPGSHSFTARYLGDSNFLPASAVPVQISAATLPDFSVSSAGSASASAADGGVATFALTVSALPGPFTGAVVLNAAGLPPGAVATFSPPQVVPGAGAATVTMTVQLPINAAQSSRASQHAAQRAALLLAGLCLICGRRRPRRWVPCLACCGALLLGGCGARTVDEGLNGVVSKTYSVQVSGTATNLAGALVVHSAAVSLTVHS